MLYVLSQASTAGVPDGWRVGAAVFTLVLRCLQKGEDETVQHYAAKVFY